MHNIHQSAYVLLVLFVLPIAVSCDSGNNPAGNSSENQGETRTNTETADRIDASRWTSVVDGQPPTTMERFVRSSPTGCWVRFLLFNERENGELSPASVSALKFEPVGQDGFSVKNQVSDAEKFQIYYALSDETEKSGVLTPGTTYRMTVYRDGAKKALQVEVPDLKNVRKKKRNTFSIPLVIY